MMTGNNTDTVEGKNSGRTTPQKGTVVISPSMVLKGIARPRFDAG